MTVSLWSFLAGALTLWAAAMAVVIVLQRRFPAATIAWLLLLVLLPIISRGGCWLETGDLAEVASRVGYQSEVAFAKASSARWARRPARTAARTRRDPAWSPDDDIPCSSTGSTLLPGIGIEAREVVLAESREVDLSPSGYQASLYFAGEFRRRALPHGNAMHASRVLRDIEVIHEIEDPQSICARRDVRAGARRHRRHGGDSVRARRHAARGCFRRSVG